MILSTVAMLMSFFTLNYAYYNVDVGLNTSQNLATQVTSNSDAVGSYLFNIFTANGLDTVASDYTDIIYVGFNAQNDYLIKVTHRFESTTNGSDMYTYNHYFDIDMPSYTLNDAQGNIYENNYYVNITCSGASETKAFNRYGSASAYNTTLLCSTVVYSNTNYFEPGEPLYDNWSVNVTFIISNANGQQYYDSGYTVGYNDGLSQQAGWNLSNYLYSIVDIPVLYLRSLFGFELFGGVSLFGVILSLITISIIVWIVRKFI